MAPTSRFWDRIAERYAKKPVADEATYQKKLEVTRGYLDPESRVFEFGCGTGSTAIAHAPHVAHVHATDISSKMIEIAQGKAEAASVQNVTFEQTTIEAVSVPDQSVDAVLALSILHLVEDLEAVIVKVHSMLKPGGVFVTSTACLRDMTVFFRIALPLMRLVRLAPFVGVFSIEELKNALAGAGFEIDHEWLPGKNKAVFIVARKAG